MNFDEATKNFRQFNPCDVIARHPSGYHIIIAPNGIGGVKLCGPATYTGPKADMLAKNNPRASTRVDHQDKNFVYGSAQMSADPGGCWANIAHIKAPQEGWKQDTHQEK